MHIFAGPNNYHHDLSNSTTSIFSNVCLVYQFALTNYGQFNESGVIKMFHSYKHVP